MPKTIHYTKEDIEKYKVLSEVLQLKDIVVVGESYEAEKNLRYFYCVMKQQLGVCPECGTVSNSVHDYQRQREVHDVLLRGQKVKLVLDSIRLSCKECEKGFTPEIRDIVKNSSYTQRLYVEIANPARKQDASTMARLYGLSHKMVENILLKAGEAKLEQRREEPLKVKQLGIDEISQKKGKETTP